MGRGGGAKKYCLQSPENEHYFYISIAKNYKEDSAHFFMLRRQGGGGRLTSEYCL